MSISRHTAEPLVRGYAVTHPTGRVVLPIEAGWDQLLYAASGVMTISARSGTWVIPAHRALWLPDGTSASVRTRGRAAVRCLYLSTSLRVLPAQPQALNVPPLVRELLLHAVKSCPLDLGHRPHAALLTLLLDQLGTAPEAPLQLPAPKEERARRLAAAMAADPAEDLASLVRGVGASRRTLDRAFVADTKMTLAAWHRRARMLRALELLAEGASVTTTAVSVGYATPSSFVAACRQELGVTPGQLVPR